MRLKTLCKQITIEAARSSTPAPESAFWVDPKHYSVKLTYTKTGRTVDFSPYSEGATERRKGRPTSYRVMAALLLNAWVYSDHATVDTFYAEFGDERGMEGAVIVYASYRVIKERLMLLLGDDFEKFTKAKLEDEDD